MPLNPLIALGSRTPNLGGRFLNFANNTLARNRQDRIDRQNQSARDRTNLLTDLQIQQAKTRIAAAGKQASAKDFAGDALRIQAALQSGDTAAASSLLDARKRKLEAARQFDPTINLNDTNSLIAAVNSNPQAALTTVNRQVDIARKLGILPNVATGKGFTLGAGQKRFDAQGNPIASVAPNPVKPDVLTPEAEAQRIRIARAKKTDISVAAPDVTVSPGETEEQKGLGKYRVGVFSDTQKEAKNAINQNRQLNALSQLLEQQATGRGTPTIRNIQALAQTFGIPIGDPKEVGAFQASETLIAEIALRMRNPESGLGLTGNTSEKDLAFLRSIPPSAGKSKIGNRLTVNALKKINDRKIAVARLADSLASDDGRFSFEDINKIRALEETPIFGEKDRALLADAQNEAGISKVGRFTVEVVE